MGEKTCGWCGRDAHKVAAQKTCRRHRQCTKAVRLERARLWPKPLSDDGKIHLQPEEAGR